MAAQIWRERYDLKKKVQLKIIAGQTTVRFLFSGRNLEAAKIWREHYDQKKNVQLSSRLCFLAKFICISFSSN